MCDLRHGDFRDVLADVAGLDAIICDPPYSRDAISLYGDLASFAVRALNDGGVLAALCGQSYLRDLQGFGDVDEVSQECGQLVEEGKLDCFSLGKGGHDAAAVASSSGNQDRQRKAGELLAATVDHQGSRPNGDSVSPLQVLGVESPTKARQLSSRWQRVAAIPEDAFVAHVERVRERGDELIDQGQRDGTSRTAREETGVHPRSLRGCP